jgi:hypothetical protein
MDTYFIIIIDYHFEAITTHLLSRCAIVHTEEPESLEDGGRTHLPFILLIGSVSISANIH